MLQDCPLCGVALPEEQLQQECARCGLVWAKIDAEEGANSSREGAIAAVSGRSLNIALRPSAGNVMLFLALGAPLGLAAFGVIAMMIAAVATDMVPYGPLGWILLLFCVPLCAAFVVLVLTAGAHGLLRLVLLARVSGAGNVLRLRLQRRWIFRTDVRVPRAELSGTALRPWQHGMREVWIRHRSGPAFRVAEPCLAEDAEALAARIDGFLKIA